MDKLFGRSPDKKKVGQSAITMVDPIKPIQNQPKVNVGNYKITNDYMNLNTGKNSPTAKSHAAFGRAVTEEQKMFKFNNAQAPL